MKTDDLRVQKTRRLLQQAVFDLTVENGFSAVTVSAIVERAQVNRSTFYRHYLDKYDLVLRYLDDLENLVVETLRDTAHVPMDESVTVPMGLLVLIKQVQIHASFFQIMLGANGDQRFTHRFRQIAQNRYRDLFAQAGLPQAGSVPVDLKLSYIAYAGVGAILWWLEQKQPGTPEQLAVWLRQLNMTAAGFSLNPGASTVLT